MAINYVRFQRGSITAYETLLASNRIDDNTLYFIYADDNADSGSLYMGTKRIGGSENSFSSMSLGDLADVITTTAGTNSFLIKNDEGNWVAKNVTDVANLIQANLSALKAQTFQAIVNKNETDLAAIERVVGDSLVNNGDIAIVKKLIANDKYEYTAYVYHEEIWASMDGNYDATNVYFDSDLIITADIGVQQIDASGSKTLNTTGKNLKQVLDMIMAARKLPSRIAPSVTIALNEDNEYEVGSTVILNYAASLSKGSYSYGPDDTEVTASAWEVKFNGETRTTSSGTFSPLTVKDDTKVRVSALATHNAGVIPVDNLGNEITDKTELNNCQIQSGTKTGYSNYITGYRKAFYGSKVAPVDIASGEIRKLSSVKATSNSLDIFIEEGSNQVIIAVPEGRKVTKVADTGAFGTNIFSEFIHSIVSVGGADANASSIGTNQKNYNVYVYNPKTALGANTYTVTLSNE